MVRTMCVAAVLIGTVAVAEAEPRRLLVSGGGGGASVDTEDNDFKSLLVTASVAGQVSRHVLLGVRASYFGGGHASGGLTPISRHDYVPITLHARFAGEYLWAELGLGPTLVWATDDAGVTTYGLTGTLFAATVGAAMSDPTVKFHPEVMVGVMTGEGGEGRVVWGGAGLHWR